MTIKTLEEAITLAVVAHAGQVDKAGAPYILHPLRVMMAMNTLEEQIVAVLHDVVEDNNAMSLEYLESAGFSQNIVSAIDSVTRRSEESYKNFIIRASQNEIGRKVKLADLKDNLDRSRILNPTNEDHVRWFKYKTALELLEEITNG